MEYFMAKKQHSKPDEFHLETIRSQLKEIRKLNQEIKRLNKLLNYRQNKVTIKELKEVSNTCIECGRGILKQVEILDRIWEICELCGKRTRIK
jgi:uncharacterized Fe-S radical SAM superfamily protein PflX